MPIWVIIDTFKSDDVIRKPEDAILAFWDVIQLRRHYDVKMTPMLFQQLRHITIQQINHPNKTFNLKVH